MFSEKKIQAFEKVYNEFLENLDKTPAKITSEIMETFKNEVHDQDEGNFANCDVKILKNITLFKKLNTEGFNWEYIHNMYFICVGKKYTGLKELISKCEKSREVVIAPKNQNLDINNMLSSFGMQNMGLDDMIKDISENVTEAFKGKDLSSINPADLISGLMKGDTNINGVDFSNIINTAAGKINSKVESGELDMSKINSPNNLEELGDLSKLSEMYKNIQK